MNLSNIRKSIQWNQQVSVFVSHLLVSLMLTCMMITLVQFGESLFPEWQGGYLPWVTFVVSVESMYTKRAARRISILSLEWVIYRGVELVVLLLGLKVLLYGLRGAAQIWTDLAAWQRDFFGNFFSGEYLIAASLMFIFWIIAGQFAEDLAELEGDEKLLHGEYPVNVSAERSQIRQRLVDRIIVYGAGMVILVSLMRIDLESFLGFRPEMRSSIVNVVLYFVLALALLSQTQFAILRASWSTQKIALNFNLGTRWLIYSILFLSGLAILAVFLPTSYTLGLLSVLGFVLSLLIFISTLVGHVLLTLLFIILSLFGVEQSGNRPAPALPPPPSPSPLIAGETPAWLAFAKSVLFWVVFLGVVGFSIYQYTKQHEELWEMIVRIPGINILRKLWQWLRGGFLSANQTLSSAVNNGLRRIQAARKADPLKDVRRLMDLRRLSARQKVLYYYLALVRRGKEYGIPRQPEQTPYEYQLKLKSSFPEIDEDLKAMTEAFYQARYSQHEVSDGQAGSVRRWWNSIRRTLRGWRKGGSK